MQGFWEFEGLKHSHASGLNYLYCSRWMARRGHDMTKSRFARQIANWSSTSASAELVREQVARDT